MPRRTSHDTESANHQEPGYKRRASFHSTYLSIFLAYFFCRRWVARAAISWKQRIGSKPAHGVFRTYSCNGRASPCSQLTVETFHKDPIPPWNWGKFRHYVLAATAMLALWIVPGLIGLVTADTFHLRSPIEPFVWIVVGASFSIGWLAGLGEETGWTAYLLPRLAPHIGKSRALVVAGMIRGLWHWPVFAGPIIWQLVSGEKDLALVLLLSLVFAVQLIISNALFGSLFGWVWYKTRSLPLMGWLHQWFDATRDVTSLLIIGFGTSLWFKILWGIPFYLLPVLS